MPARLTIEDMCKLAKVRGGKCLSLEYIGSKAKLQWQCAKGHTWQATPSSVKTKTWCPDCAGVVRLTIDQMRKTAKVRDGECLSQKYLGALVKLEWLCSAGHKWWATKLAKLEGIAEKLKRGENVKNRQPQTWLSQTPKQQLAQFPLPKLKPSNSLHSNLANLQRTTLLELLSNPSLLKSRYPINK